MATQIASAKKLIINKLTQAQHDSIPEKDPAQLYLITDAEVSGGTSGFTKEEADWFYIAKDESGAAMFDMIARTQGQITVPDKPGTLALLSDLEGLSGGEGCLTQEQADLLYAKKDDTGAVEIKEIYNSEGYHIAIPDQGNLAADDSSTYAATTAWVQRAIDNKLSGIESILDELNGETLEG